MVTTVIIGTLFTVIEITLDFFVFGGIAVKDGTQLEYLKSSASGMKVMETALGVNMVRQFATLVVLFAGAAAIVWAKGGKIVVEPLWIACYVSMLLSSYVVINIVLVVMRHFDGFYLNVAASSFAMILMILFIFLFGVNAYIMFPVLSVLAVASSVLGRRLVMRRVKESYYDRAI